MKTQSVRAFSLALALPALVLSTFTIHQARALSFSVTGSMTVDRWNHTATPLPNGKVLVAGGNSTSSGGCLSSTELYEPTAGTWTATGAMTTPRSCHTATLLPNGTVLVTGGYGTGNASLSSAELYDPATGTWRTTGSMSTYRTHHTATLLSDGKLLVAAGLSGDLGTGAELYNPTTGTWTLTGSLNAARYDYTAMLLQTGKVLVAGGGNRSAELYDPAAGAWTTTASMTDIRTDHTAVLLPSGKVLVAGGFLIYMGSIYYLSSAELYDPTTSAWVATGAMNTPRAYHTATVLSNGQVLVAGGWSDNEPILSSAELYDPAAGTWTAAGSMTSMRAEHAATLLTNGMVLLEGGLDGGAGAELAITAPGGPAPLILFPPSGATNCAGTLATFTVTAAGSTLTYQWLKGGTDLADGGKVSGAHTPLLTLTNVLHADAAGYSVIVSNQYGCVTSSVAVLTVVEPCIASQPMGQSTNAGATVTFTVGANGTPPLKYQWRKGGLSMLGATTNALSLTNVLGGDAGAYSVVVSNAYGSLTSLTAVLSVVDPFITEQPTNVAVNYGQNALLSVSAAGTAPLRYQWRKVGSDLPGATADVLAFSDVHETDMANYCVAVSSPFGSVTSSIARLSVVAPISLVPLGQLFTGGGADVAVAGRYAYVTAGLLEDDLEIIDVHDPSHCVRAGGNGPDEPSDGVAVSGHYAYVASGGGALEVWDVADPTNCVCLYVGCPFGYSWNGQDVAVSGDYVYVVDGYGYFMSFCVANPANCIPLQYFRLDLL